MEHDILYATTDNIIPSTVLRLEPNVYTSD